MGISTDFDINIDKNGDFESVTTITQDNVPTLTHNQFLKINDASQGWSKSREGAAARKVARIPVIAMKQAEDEGWNLDDQKQLRAWIGLHPEFWCVEHLNNPQRRGWIIK